MKSRSEIDRVMEAWLADGPTAIPDRVVEVVAARIGVQRQRRAWPVPGRIHVPTPFKLVAALAAAVVVAVAGYNLLPKQGGSGGQSTTPPTTAPTVAPTTAPATDASPIAVPESELTGARYRFAPLSDDPSFEIVATGPQGWGGVPPWAMVGPNPVGTDHPTGIGVAFLAADGLYRDPCHWDVDGSGEVGQPGDVAVGPSVEDLVVAIRANKSYTASDATPLTIDGYKGQELVIQLPDDPFTTCDVPADDAGGDGRAFVFSGVNGGLYAQGPANRWHLFIVDVDGTRLTVVVPYYQGTPQAEVDAAENVVDTLDINP